MSSLHLAMSCLVLHWCYYLLFLPLFLPVDPETDAAAGYIYDPADQSFATEQQGKQIPLDHSYIAYVFLPTACISILLLL